MFSCCYLAEAANYHQLKDQMLLQAQGNEIFEFSVREKV